MANSKDQVKGRRGLRCSIVEGSLEVIFDELNDCRTSGDANLNVATWVESGLSFGNSRNKANLMACVCNCVVLELMASAFAFVWRNKSVRSSESIS